MQIKIKELYLVRKVEGNLLFKVYEANALYIRTAKQVENTTTSNDILPYKIPNQVRLANRVIDLQTSAA
jgi:hypothetical protein